MRQQQRASLTIHCRPSVGMPLRTAKIVPYVLFVLLYFTARLWACCLVTDVALSVVVPAVPCYDTTRSPPVSGLAS